MILFQAYVIKQAILSEKFKIKNNFNLIRNYTVVVVNQEKMVLNNINKTIKQVPKN